MLTNITPPHFRRIEALVHTVSSCLIDKRSLLFQIINKKPIDRLKSRKSPCLTAENLINTQFCSSKLLNEELAKAHVIHKDHVISPDLNMEGMVLLPRKQWSTINQIRTEHGGCGSLLFKWHYKDTPECDCGKMEQTISHIVKIYPKR